MTKLQTEMTSHCDRCQQYYRISKLAELLDVSEKTIRRAILEGEVKAKRIRGSIRIPHGELVKLIRDY